MTQLINQTIPAAVANGVRVEVAAQRLYDAETALHAARQSHVDRWVDAAGDRLHDAIVCYLTARAEVTGD